MAQITLESMLERCTVEKQPNGKFTVWMEKNPPRGSIENCEGEDDYEIIEDAFLYLQQLEGTIDNGDN